MNKVTSPKIGRPCSLLEPNLGEELVSEWLLPIPYPMGPSWVQPKKSCRFNTCRDRVWGSVQCRLGGGQKQCLGWTDSLHCRMVMERHLTGGEGTLQQLYIWILFTLLCKALNLELNSWRLNSLCPGWEVQGWERDWELITLPGGDWGHGIQTVWKGNSCRSDF